MSGSGLLISGYFDDINRLTVLNISCGLLAMKETQINSKFSTLFFISVEIMYWLILPSGRQNCSEIFAFVKKIICNILPYLPFLETVFQREFIFDGYKAKALSE